MAGADLPVLVLGATGGQDGAVASALLTAGRPVRALVRDPGSDRAELAAAMRRISAAFALTTSFESGTPADGTAAELQQGQAIIEAATSAELPFLLFSSVAGALGNSGVPHFDSKAAVERALADSDLRYAVVAPTYFYDNALGGYQVDIESLRGQYRRWAGPRSLSGPSARSRHRDGTRGHGERSEPRSTVGTMLT